VKRNNVARSHDELFRGNTGLCSFLLLTHARPSQQHNTYLFIVALCTSPPVTGSTLKAPCKVSDTVVRLKKTLRFYRKLFS